jgi:peptidyl-prolyl cis-trans isomerase D
MISWIQRTFQQHFKWLFLILLVFVIVSFIFITNASSGLGQASRHLPSRPFFGINLNSTEDSQALVKDATLSVQLHGRRLQIRSEAQFQQYALQRHAALHLANELNLPAPTQEQLARHVQSLGAFAGANGSFDPKIYAAFRDSLDTNPQIREADVSRVIAEDVIYQEVLSLLSGPGYTLPVEVKNQLERADSLWTIEAVAIDFDSYKPAITPTDEALAKFFEQNASSYEIPAMVGAAYVDFPSSAFAGQVTFSEEGLRAYYDANSTRFLPPLSDKPEKPLAPDAAFAAARAKVEEAYRAERARNLANAAASELSVALYEKKVSADALPAFLKDRQLALKSVAPFNAQNTPAELGSSRGLINESRKIGPDHLYSDPVDTGHGAAILVWKESIPARQPGFAEVKERVKADYIERERHRLFVESGRALRTALETRLKAGDTLAKALSASSSVIAAKTSIKTWPAFTLATPPQDIDYSVYGAISGLQKGELSPMISSVEQGFIVYAADRKVPDVDPASAKYTETRDRLAAIGASRNGGEILAQIVDTELAKTAPANP